MREMDRVMPLLLCRARCLMLLQVLSRRVKPSVLCRVLTFHLLFIRVDAKHVVTMIAMDTTTSRSSALLRG